MPSTPSALRSIELLLVKHGLRGRILGRGDEIKEGTRVQRNGTPYNLEILCASVVVFELAKREEPTRRE